MKKKFSWKGSGRGLVIGIVCTLLTYFIGSYAYANQHKIFDCQLRKCVPVSEACRERCVQRGGNIEACCRECVRENKRCERRCERNHSSSGSSGSSGSFDPYKNPYGDPYKFKPPAPIYTPPPKPRKRYKTREEKLADRRARQGAAEYYAMKRRQGNYTGPASCFISTMVE